ncbi:hypothetical protein SAOR_00920 [Salinisphaera orenii MK-B5]|uniref:Uncharacterized protein n=2 Tax=Salinisphaera TaxID=180541 RepID=A0A423PYI6_9GAMM|nr:hypothetical protein SAOR_00920 [Salinisphaera orenii MK-B5]
MAQDHSTYDSRGMPAKDVTASDYVFRAQSLGEACKVQVFPDRRLLMGIAGSVVYGMAWLHVLDQRGDDIDGLAGYATDELRRIFHHYKPALRECYVLHAGFSAAEGRVIGLLYQAENDFVPVRLPAGAVMHSPHLSGDAPGIDRAEALAEQARCGRRVPEFFDAMFANQKWQCEHRRLRAGVLLSDDYTLASVDSDGARVVQGAEAAAVA